MWRSNQKWHHVVLITRSERVSMTSYAHEFVYLSSDAPEMIGKVGRWAEVKDSPWEKSRGMLERVEMTSADGSHAA